MSVLQNTPDLLRPTDARFFRGVRAGDAAIGRWSSYPVGAVEESYREIEFGITIILHSHRETVPRVI